jgi:hypothetical protein
MADGAHGPSYKRAKKRGRPRKRGKRRVYRGTPPSERKTPYKPMLIRPLTHAMVKELAGYYETSMMDIVHKLIDAAFKKTLLKLEEDEKGES